MFVFRRVNVSDMAANRYYIKKVYSKSAEVEGVHCPRREVGSVSIQKIPSAEGIRKEKKRKLEAILAAADIRQMVSLFEAICSKSHVSGVNFKASHNCLNYILCVVHTKVTMLLR